MFTQDDLIHVYTRREALDDGVQIDANVGDLVEVSRRHFKYPVFMTAAVHALINQAVANERHNNDRLGVWHDILWMANLYGRRQGGSETRFKVIITGVGRKRYQHLKATVGPLDFDDPAPCVTVMLANED